MLGGRISKGEGGDPPPGDPEEAGGAHVLGLCVVVSLPRAGVFGQLGNAVTIKPG